jgi:hypothetical protein
MTEVRPMLIADGGDVQPPRCRWRPGSGEAPGGLWVLRQQHRHAEVRH